MRIGIDARLWSESGVGRYTRNLVKELQIIDKKNEYVLFSLSNNQEEILNHLQCKQVQNDNFRIVRADIRWHSIEEQFRFPSILNRENLDLVHFPYFSVPIFYNKFFVVTIHDLILHHFPTGEASILPLPIYQLKLLGYKYVISQAARKAKKIITVSNATKQEIIDHLRIHEDKIVVTHEGVSINSKFKVQSSKLQLKIKNYFLYIGNAYPHKNLDRLLQALNILISQYLNIFLVFVGKEDYFYKRLKEKVRRMGLFDVVIFYGEASDEELVSLYQNALALVLPSFMEGFGLPALEAMDNKCLILASDIPVLHEVCGDAAIYFNPYDIKDIKSKIEEISSNGSKHLDKKIELGFERVKMFSWQKMARETLVVYEKVAGVIERHPEGVIEGAIK